MTDFITYDYADDDINRGLNNLEQYVNGGHKVWTVWVSDGYVPLCEGSGSPIIADAICSECGYDIPAGALVIVSPDKQTDLCVRCAARVLGAIKTNRHYQRIAALMLGADE